MKEVVIVSAVRTPCGRGVKGGMKDTRPDELLALTMREAINRARIKDEELDDIIIGCAMPEAEQGMNVARISALRAGIPYSIPAMTINRFCSSGLQAIALAGERIMVGHSDCILAGGVESMSMVPMGGWRFRPNPYLVDNYPEAYTPMGLTAENVAERFGITREVMDRFAYESHMKAVKAIKEGKFSDEIIPVRTTLWVEGEEGRMVKKEVVIDRDECVRPDTNMDVLLKLKPAFKQNGNVTAGNSSPINDGAACLVVTSREFARERGLKILGIYRRFDVVGVPPDIMGVGPLYAIPKLLKMCGLTIDDIDLFEINEAFASQAYYCVKELNIPPEKVNVNGGAIALGHPLGATGAKLTVSLLYEMERRDAKRGVVSMCVGGGMGAAALFERG